MDPSMEAVFYAIALMLPLAALVARRLPIGTTIKMALAWAAIFAIGALLAAAFT